MSKIYRKYSNLMYGNYIEYARDNRLEVFPLAPPNWEAIAKKHYIVNTSYPPKHIRHIINDSRVNTTFYVLSKLLITGQRNTTVQLVIIKNEVYVDPYFNGISENIFFNSYCHVPNLRLTTRSLSAIELKIDMLGGILLKENLSTIDILIYPRIPARKNTLQLMHELDSSDIKNIVNISTLNQIFRRYFIHYPICNI